MGDSQLSIGSDGFPIPRQQLSQSRRHGHINDYNIQRLAINKVIEILGSRIWRHGFKSGHRMREWPIVLQEARLACKFDMHVLPKAAMSLPRKDPDSSGDCWGGVG